MKNIFFIHVTNHEKKLPYYLYGSGSDYEQEEVNNPKGYEWY